MLSSEQVSASLKKAREGARDSLARSPPQSKHWTWLFKALWSGAYKTRVRAAVPDTIIWEDGVPTRWLGTDTRGFLVRKDLSPPGSKLFSRERLQRMQSPQIRNEFFELERIKMIRNSMSKFSETNLPDDKDSENIASKAICIAEYADGVREELTAAQLDYLAAHREWRIQLLVLQARVPARKVALGIYNRNAPASLASNAEAAAKAAANLAHGPLTDAPDELATYDSDLSHLAMALARFVEVTYVPSKSSKAAMVDSTLHSDLGAIVERLAVEVVVDAAGKLWVVRATELQIAFVHRAPAHEDTEQARARLQALESADLCAKQLRRLLQLAAKRDVPFEASYAHFDRQGQGRVDVGDLIAGLHLLGIDLTMTAAEFLLERISSSPHAGFSPADLWAFAELEGPFVDPVLTRRQRQQQSRQTNCVDKMWHQRARQLLGSYDTHHGAPAPQFASGSCASPSTSAANTCTIKDSTNKEVTCRKTSRRNDPLGVLPGTRASTRKAMQELIQAARRRRKSSLRVAAVTSCDSLPQEHANSRPMTSQSSRPITSETKATEASGSDNDSEENVIGALSDTAESKNHGAAAQSKSHVTCRLPRLTHSFFHVEPGLVMTYKILRSRSTESKLSDSTNILAQAETAQYANGNPRHATVADNISLASNSESRLLLVALPDIFHTLETLEAALDPILVQYCGRGDALLVGLPGLPYTCWPPETPLNNTLHAKCLRRLLQHLSESGEISSPAATRCRTVFVGFGNGACTLAHFLSSAPNNPVDRQCSFALLDEKSASAKDDSSSIDHVGSTVAGILVNGFFACEGPIRRTLNNFKRIFARGTHEERLQAVVDTHFSIEHLTENSRDTVLREFWATRSDLSFANDSETVHFSTEARGGEQCAGSCADVLDGCQGSIAGLRASLRGALVHQDVRPYLASIDAPLILLQSESNRFVPPQRAIEDLYANRPDELCISATVAGAINSSQKGGAYVAKVKAGHEIIQEQAASFRSLLLEVLHAGFPSATTAKATLDRTLTPPSSGVNHRASDAPHIRDARRREIIQEDRQSKHGESPVEISQLQCNSVLADGSDCESYEKTNRDSSDSSSKELPETSEKMQAEIRDDPEGHAQLLRSSNDQIKHRRPAASSKKKEVNIANREVALRRLREGQSEESRRATQVAERFAMRAEDLHSHAAREYYFNTKLYEQGVQKAGERAKYLMMARDAEEAIEIEDRLKRERSRQHAESRVKESESESKLLREITTFDKRSNFDLGKLMGCDDPSMLLELAKAAKSNMDELLLSRRRLVQALQKCSLVEHALNIFKQSLDAVEREVRRLNRTLRLLETNDDLRDSLAPEPIEVEELVSAHRCKSDEHVHLQEIVQNRSRRLEFANYATQTLKALVAEKEKAATTFGFFLGKVARVLREKRGRHRLLKAQFEHQAGEQYNAIRNARKRIAVVGQELARLRNYSGKLLETYLDRRQRMETLNVRASLEKEKKTLDASLADMEAKRDDFENRRRRAYEEQHRFDVDAKAVEEISQTLTEALTEYRRLGIMEELRRMEREQDLAEAELAESEEFEANGRRAAACAFGDLLASRVRYKAPSSRTEDEKRWVALDSVVNPIAYSHVTETEAEQMKFDPDYMPHLTADDIIRILKLPHQVQLAIPFLFNQDEINAHRLLCQYTHEEGEAYFKHIDRTGSQSSKSENAGVFDHIDSGPGGSGREAILSGRVPMAEQLAAQHHLETTLRERRLARMRSKSNEELTDKERKYLILDRILNPWLYEGSSKVADPDIEIPCASTLTESFGDKYDPLRAAYAQGASDIRTRLLNADWHPKREDGQPHDRQSLIEAAKNPADNEVYALLAEYYVEDSTTTIGRRDQATIRDLQKRISDTVRRQQQIRLQQMQQDELLETPIDCNEPRHDSSAHVNSRMWGGWDSVHPASSGLKGQLRLVGSDFDFAREHPASFACKRAQSESTVDAQTIVDPSLARSCAAEASYGEFVIKDLEGLNKLPPFKLKHHGILFECDSCDTQLLSHEGQALEARGSRTHRFEVPNEKDRRLMSLTVTIVYQGVFTARGYRVGRVAAAAFRLPTSTADVDQPIPIGYAPYHQQQLNTGTNLGRIVINHRPDDLPIKPGPYHVVVGAASSSKYSIAVEAHAVQTAEAKLRSEASRASTVQSDLSSCTLTIEEIWTSMRLAERKALVVQALLDEAEVESSRCEQESVRCNRELLLDDDRMLLNEEQRADLNTEVRRLEVEFAHWCRLFATRSQERRDLLASLDTLRKEHSRRTIQKESLEKEFQWLQRYLPAATCLIHGMDAAVDCALSLNTSFAHIPTTNARGLWDKVSSARRRITATMTPAQEVRRRYRTEGWSTLCLPEQQWTILDRKLNPKSYEWVQDAACKELESEIDRNQHNHMNPLKMSQRAQKNARDSKKLNRAIRAMQSFSAGELERIRKLPFAQVARGNETTAWKLMRQFHDDPQRLIDDSKSKAKLVDPNTAAAVRFKHPKSLSREEREWVTLDKTLNPEIWGGLKIRSTAGEPYQNLQKIEQEKEYLEPFESGEASVAIGQRRGMQFGSNLGSVVQMTMAERTKRLAEFATGRDKPEWECKLDREELLAIWAARDHNPKWDVDQCKARRLLEKFNGDYEVYASLQEHIKSSNKTGRRVHRFFASRPGELSPRAVETDVDARCRSLQSELDMAINNSNPIMSSNVLHGGVGQRFPTHILRLELEAELDALLREQVYERERAQRYLLEQDDHRSPDDSSDEDDAMRPRPNRDISREVYVARKAVLRERSSDEATRQFEREIKLLGPEACLACLTSKCQWCTSIDVSAIEERRQAIANELSYVRKNADMKTVESYVPLSASRGGNPHFRREDIIHELAWEEKQLMTRVQLNAIDRELHDAYATRKEYVEVRAIHAYPTLMWTSNARLALQREHNRLVATVVANDIVDDAIAWMFEGWYFGERESSFSVAGYVPSLKPDGMIRLGTDQIIAQSKAEKRDAHRAETEAAGSPTLDSAMPGSPRSKAEAVEVEAQFRLSNEKVVKAGSDREKHIDFTERTLKFGLFCITLMFFRAMALISRERESWSGKNDAIGAENIALRTKPSKERQRMRHEQQRKTERSRKLNLAMQRAKTGEERIRNRIAKEREEAARKLFSACNMLQAVYRGHLGRKAAHRWAIKRAELEAMNALMTASAITIERVYRGFVGRTAASIARMEMAEFISMIRMKEAVDDEDEYWRTHTYSRFKRNVNSSAKVKLIAKKLLAAKAKEISKEDEIALVNGLTKFPRE